MKQLKLRPPSNSSTTLSCDAAEFVPSFSSTFWPSEASFHGQLAENYYNQYNFYENPYNYATVEDNFDLGEETLIGEKEVWGNMLDILKGWIMKTAPVITKNIFMNEIE